MKISPLPNSKQPEGSIAESITEFEKMFGEYFDATDIPNQGRVKDCKSQDCCFLDFYFYYDPFPPYLQGYKNGIWIQVNKKDIWLFVLVNEKGLKKVSITSASDLKCPAFPQVESGNICPPTNFVEPFAYYEKLRVAVITYQQLFANIVARLPCVCNS